MGYSRPSNSRACQLWTLLCGEGAANELRKNPTISVRKPHPDIAVGERSSSKELGWFTARHVLLWRLAGNADPLVSLMRLNGRAGIVAVYWRSYAGDRMSAFLGQRRPGEFSGPVPRASRGRARSGSAVPMTTTRSATVWPAGLELR